MHRGGEQKGGCAVATITIAVAILKTALEAIGYTKIGSGTGTPTGSGASADAGTGTSTSTSPGSGSGMPLGSNIRRFDPPTLGLCVGPVRPSGAPV